MRRQNINFVYININYLQDAFSPFFFHLKNNKTGAQNQKHTTNKPPQEIKS